MLISFSLCECLYVCCSLVFLCFFLPGFYFSLVGGHYKNKIPQLRGPLEAIKCIFMLQAAVCFFVRIVSTPIFFFWYPRYVYLICQMPNETFYDEFCDPKNQIPQLPETQTLPSAYIHVYLPFHPRCTRVIQLQVHFHLWRKEEAFFISPYTKRSACFICLCIR